ncbi:MAG: Sec-independent protein translocase protein TatB [Rhizobiaceae bacterium]|nr:Sec-independent protein translocase protein TatB [Rhizobiaceae bacterium]
MFDIGWTEMLVVAVVMILVVGPKDLPGMLRTIGKSIGNMRRMASDFQRQFSDALKEAEIDEIKKDFSQAATIDNPLDDITKSADELMGSLGQDVDDAIGADVSDTKPIGTPAKKPARAKKVKKAAAKKPPTKPATSKAPSKARTVRKKPAVKKPPAKRQAAKRKTATGSKTA